MVGSYGISTLEGYLMPNPLREKEKEKKKKMK